MSRTVRLVALDGVTTLVDLEDPANGLRMSDLDEPSFDELAGRYTSPRSIGGFRQGPSRLSEGEATVNVIVLGGSWGEVETRSQAMLAAVQQYDDFLLQSEIDGVLTTYHAERRSIRKTTPSGRGYVDAAVRVYEFRFICQPNPTVTVLP